MIIRSMFERPIDRDIKGVIKVGQDDQSNIRQELEEYVVTRELQKHFAEFFTNYKRSINGTTDKMGAWLSGFFGSGKSHLLKILSYILSNRVVDGKPAVNYFYDKISDRMVLADMKLATSVPTDVILFNIDSKSTATGKHSKDAIVNVFLRAFNEMQGFCGTIPFLADLERNLTEKGKYDAFREKFEEINGRGWESQRDEFDFIQDDIVDALVDIDFMSEEAARNWCEKAANTYEIAISDFAKMVKRYIDGKGRNHHVVFLVDEIGQYIGDDSQLMLNLQTVTEDLGTACGGKCWIIVTSQQDIDSITKTKGNDFSKIQGRFDTRLSLSSANVDEVIRKRILAKNETGAQTLTLLYDDKATVIKNLIMFNDGIEKKLYSDRGNFSAVYPFIPYQFNLLGGVLTSIRTHGASGKHLAEGERSMLALFKESAVKVMNTEPGTLVPFNMFYDALERFLDHSHAGVISHALDNEYLNPDHADECFDVNVLKTLFMVKYVKEIRANLDNITSLMVSHIDDDRLELRERVEKALQRLIRQTLVQKNGDIYVFLTDEEQEINRAIDNQNVETGEVIAKVSELIFDGLFDEKRYRYPAFNGRYQFAYNQFVDDRPHKNNQNYDISLRIITPGSDVSGDETTMRMLSGQSKCVVVALPDDAAFMDEIRASLKIEKFLRYDAGNAVTKYEQIKEAKKIEMRDHNSSARLFLEEALRQAAIYVNGDRVPTAGKEIASRINEAMGKLISSVYHKLSYIDAAMNENELRMMLKATGKQLTIGGMDMDRNKLALADVRSYIADNTARHMKTSMKSIMDRFMRAPYGFVEADVQWLVGKLFKDGDIAFTVNSEPVTLISKTMDELVKILTRKEYLDKLLTEKRERPDERKIKAVREVVKELFGATITTDDVDEIMQNFRTYASNFRQALDKLEIRYMSQKAYPGKSIVTDGKKLMSDFLAIKGTTEFFNTVFSEKDTFLDLAEDYEKVKSFFGGDQVGIFDKSLLLMGIYEESKNFIPDEKVYAAYDAIRQIIRMKEPYGQIYKLPGLNQNFTDLYDAILDAKLIPVKEAVAEARKRVFDELTGKRCHDMLVDRYVRIFTELENKAEACNNVATLQNITLEADALKIRLLGEIAKKEDELTPKPVDPPVNPVGPVDPPKPKQKKKKTVSIKSITNTTTWQMETPEDVQKYIADLQKKLMAQLEENTIVNIEF